MGMPDTQGEQYFTYDDYLKWPDEERWEIIEGRAYALSPSPTWRHQQVVGTLHYLLRQFFEGKPCKVYLSPLDVRLPNLDEQNAIVDTVVQPDLLVLCDPAKLDERGVLGAPDLVIEILSESTTHRDLYIKLRLYEKHGVRCYIIADPWGKTLTIRTLGPDGRYALPELFAGPTPMPIRIFEGLVLDVERVFEGI
jgi:Uma2 family endonuclease